MIRIYNWESNVYSYTEYHKSKSALRNKDNYTHINTKSKTVNKMAKHVKVDVALLQSLIFNVKGYSQTLLSIHPPNMQ